MDPSAVQPKRIGYERRKGAMRERTIATSEEDYSRGAIIPTIDDRQSSEICPMTLNIATQTDLGDDYITMLTVKYRAMHERRRYLYGESMEVLFNRDGVDHGTVSCAR